MITLEDAKFNLKIGQILYHVTDNNRDGSPQRWKVNGHARNWVRKPDRVEVPLKYGLYNYAYLTERHLDDRHSTRSSQSSRTLEYVARHFESAIGKLRTVQDHRSSNGYLGPFARGKPKHHPLAGQNQS